MSSWLEFRIAEIQDVDAEGTRQRREPRPWYWVLVRKSEPWSALMTSRTFRTKAEAVDDARIFRSAARDADINRDPMDADDLNG